MSEAQPHGVAEQTLCAMCPVSGVFRWTDCREIKYCSKQCQKSDWPIHKIICKSLKDFSENQRPDHHHKRAIRFPQNGEQPHFFWLRYATRYSPYVNDNKGGIETVPALSGMLGATDVAYNGQTIDVFRRVILDRRVENRFDIIGKFREACCQDEIPVNETNRSLLSIDRELSDACYGEIIAFGVRPTMDGGPKHAYDMGALEFRHAVDALRMRYDQAHREREKIVDGPSVIGVRCANLSDFIHGGCKMVEDIPVSANFCNAESEIDTPLCDRLGIPIVLHRLPLSLTSRDRRLGITSEWTGMNGLLHYLNPFLSDTDRLHGVGSAIAVRKDGKALFHAHMAALFEYCQRLNKQHEVVTGSKVWTPADLALCTKEDFAAWYESWKQLRSDASEVDFDVPFPYEI